MRTPVAQSERFWSLVDMKESESCWPWRGSTNLRGYGIFRFDSREFYAHRIAFHLDRGWLSPHHECHHVCRNKGCVNPRHLVMVTTSQHIRLEPRNKPKTHCPSGHAYEGDNVLVWPNVIRNGKVVYTRRCRECERARGRRRRLQTEKDTA